MQHEETNMIFKPANILIPKGIDFKKWSVIACDQHTSEPEYWEEVKEIVDGSPSTFNIIFPEIYLNNRGRDERIKKINSTMNEYLNSGIFEEFDEALVYITRTQSNGKTSCGIVGMIDLEEYDFSPGSKSKIRATEGTITGRIPPRQKIRSDAPLEVPHIIMLIDDRARSVIEPLNEKKFDFEKLYDFDLMLDGGHISGYLVPLKEHRRIFDALSELENKQAFNSKYGMHDEDVLVYAVGDGNHSLATAKACWEEIKIGLTAEEIKTHPARYALVEIENIHDEALEFDSIQRVLFGVNPEHVLKKFIERNPKFSFENNGGHRIRYTYNGKLGEMYIKEEATRLPVAIIRDFIKEYLDNNSGRVDFIHGDDTVIKLAQKPDTIGIMVDPMKKSELFKTVIRDGSLPRKTFSMGEASDKRYYLECKKIR